jgi:small subunit ribosomal protein S17
MNENVETVRKVTGRVVSNKMDKTASVLVERLVKHPVYGKYIKRSTKLLVHDENNVCQEGDMVSITSCRPISKNKAFKLLEILEVSNK